MKGQDGMENYGFVYILRCEDDSLYTGWTTDLMRRLRLHNAGKASKYTASRRPVHLVYAEAVGDKSEALKREYAIKQLTRGEKLVLIEVSKSTSQARLGVNVCV